MFFLAIGGQRLSAFTLFEGEIIIMVWEGISCDAVDHTMILLSLL